MEIEDREATDSGSLNGNLELESPSAGGEYFGLGGNGVPGVPNMNISAEADGGSRGNGNFSTAAKKRRGRPRKYDADGNLHPSYIKSSPPPPSEDLNLPSPPSYEFSGPKRGRGRGRPPGSRNLKSVTTIGGMATCEDFILHVITVEAGEDVAAKILTFAQKGDQGICVLSANGPVSSVTLRQPGSSGGLVTYEGLFDILTLSGSYTVSEGAGIKSRSGGLSISLASPSGRVFGGGVAGMLTAANLIQIVVGTFVPNGSKLQKNGISPAVPVPESMIPSATPQESTLGEADHSFFQRELHRAAKTDQNGSGHTDSIVWHPHPDINIPMPAED